MYKIYDDNKVSTYRVLILIYLSQVIFYIYIRGLLINSSVSAQSFTIDSDAYERINLINSLFVDKNITIIIFVISIYIIAFTIAINVFHNASFVFRLTLCTLPLSIISSYFIINSFSTHLLTNFIYPTIPLYIIIITVIYLILTFIILKLLQLRIRKEENVKNNKL